MEEKLKTAGRVHRRKLNIDVFGLLVTFLWLPFAAFPIFNLWQMLFSWFPFFFIALIIAYILMKKSILKEPDKKTLEAADALPVLGKRKPF